MMPLTPRVPVPVFERRNEGHMTPFIKKEQDVALLAPTARPSNAPLAALAIIV